MINNETEKKSSLQQMLESVRNMMKNGAKESKLPGDSSASMQDILELTEAEFVEQPENGEKASPTNNDVLSQLDNILKQAETTNVENSNEEKASPNVDEALEALMEEKLENESNSTVNAEENTPVTEVLVTPVVEENKEIDKENIAPLENKIIEEVKDALISETASNATISAIRALKKKIERPLTDGLSFRSGITMEDLVIEAIKPYLSEWLDKNLPNVVKHLVEKELKKLIPNDD